MVAYAAGAHAVHRVVPALFEFTTLGDPHEVFEAQAVAEIARMDDMEENDEEKDGRDVLVRRALQGEGDGAVFHAQKVGIDLTAGQQERVIAVGILHEDGTATFRETLVDYAPEDGPDGLICDADGNLVVAVRAESRPGICFYSPKGKELAYLETEVPTNVGFGRGDDSNLLYVTAGQSLYRVRLNTHGYQLPASK